MLSRRRSRTLSLVVGAAVAGLVLAGCATTDPEPGGDNEVDYPNGPIQYVVPYNPGGSTDPVGREFSRMLAEELGTTEVVENLPGGDETIGIASVIEADPDGQRLGLSSATGIIVQPLVNPDLPFQDASDYTPIVMMVEAPNAIMVAADSPLETLDDLIAAAKDAPGEISVGTTGRLTNNTFVLVALEEAAGIDLNIVPFSGGAGEAVLATIGGQIDAVIPTAAGQLGLVEAGDIRPLAHTGGAEYNDILEGAVSFGDEGYDMAALFSSNYVTVAPAGLDDAVREKLVAAALAVAESDEWAQWCADKGFISKPMAGDELDQWIEDVTQASIDAIALVEASE